MQAHSFLPAVVGRTLFARLPGWIVTIAAAMLISGCGGGAAKGGGAAAVEEPAAEFSIAADVTGLQGQGLVLTLDQAEDVAVAADGHVAFSRKVRRGQTVSLAVKAQPTSPAQTCLVDAVPAVEADTTVAVRCGFATPGFVYVGGGGGGIDVLQADAATGALTVVQNVVLERPRKLAVTPDQGLLIAYSEAEGNLRSFRIDPATGRLAPTQSVPVGVGGPTQILTHPKAKYVYVVENAANSIAVLSLDAATGQFTRMSTMAMPAAPLRMVMTADALRLYVITADNAVRMYTVDEATATLDHVQAVSTGGAAIKSVVLDPFEAFLYVGDAASVYTYRIDPATGLLTPRGVMGLGGTGLAMHPNGRYLFVYSPDDRIRTYSVDRATGDVTALGTPVPTKSSLQDIVACGSQILTPNVLDSGVSVYSVDAKTGQPSLVGDYATTSLFPGSIAVTTTR